MPTLLDIRRLFRRRSRPVVVDINGTQAEGLAGARDNGGTAVATDASGGSRRKAHAVPGMIEPKPLRNPAGGDGGANLEEVMGLVRRIGTHLESQTERTERLLGLIERLPRALDALPEINRQNAHLLDALHEHFSQAKGREETLNATLGRMTEATGHQTEILGLIQGQVESNSRNASQLTDTLDLLREALGDLAVSSRSSTEVLSQMAETSARRETEMTGMLLRSQRWLLAIGLCCGAASVAALAVACVALLR